MPMDSGLKQRLVGAAVLVAVGVIFMPMLIKEPPPDSTVSALSFKMPDAPDEESGSVTVPLSVDLPGGEPLAETQMQSQSPPSAGRSDPQVVAEPPAEAELTLPPAAANGKYVVHFASFPNQDAADLTLHHLQAHGLSSVFTESANVNGRPAVRVRIGPYATQAEAEIVRVKAAQVRTDVQPRVFMLIDDGVAERAAAALEQSSPTRPAAGEVGFVVQLGAFSSTARARDLQERVRTAGIVAFTDTVNTARGRLTRVNAGPVTSRREAEQLKARLKSTLAIDGVVRSHP